MALNWPNLHQHLPVTCGAAEGEALGHSLDQVSREPRPAVRNTEKKYIMGKTNHEFSKIYYCITERKYVK